MRETNYHSYGKVSFDVTNANFGILLGLAPILLHFLSYLEVDKETQCN